MKTIISIMLEPKEMERRIREDVTCESCEEYKNEDKNEELKKQGYHHCNMKSTLSHRLEARNCPYYKQIGEIK